MKQYLTDINQTNLNKLGLNAEHKGDVIYINLNEKNFRGMHDVIHTIHVDNNNEVVSKLNDFVSDEDRLRIYVDTFKEMREKYRDIEASFDRNEITYSIDNDNEICDQRIHCRLKLHNDRSVDCDVEVVNSFMESDSYFTGEVNERHDKTVVLDDIEFLRERLFTGELGNVYLEDVYQAKFPNVKLHDVDNISKQVASITNEDSFVREFAPKINELYLSDVLAEEIINKHIHEDNEIQIMKINKLQTHHERSVIETEDPSVNFDFSNIKEAYVLHRLSGYPVPVGISDEKWNNLYELIGDDIYETDRTGIEYDYGVDGKLVAMVTNDGELIEMYDNSIDVSIYTPWELKDSIFIDSYEELSNKINGELLSAAFDDLQTETGLKM